MPNLHELFEERQRATYTPTLDVDTIRAEGARRRRHQHVLRWSLIAGSVVLLLAVSLIAWQILRPSTTPNPSLDVRDSGSPQPSQVVTPDTGNPAHNVGGITRSQWLPAVDQLGWTLADFTNLRVTGDMSAHCKEFKALGDNAGIIGQIRGRVGSELAVTVFSGKVAADAATRACEGAGGTTTSVSPLAGGTTWSTTRRTDDVVDQPRRGQSAVLHVGDKTVVAQLLWPTAMGADPYKANWDVLLQQLRTPDGRTAQRPLGFTSGPVGPSTFIGANDVATPTGAPWQEWMYDEDGSDPGEGFDDGHPRTLVLTQNDVELVIHAKLLASPELAQAEAQRAIVTQTKAGGAFAPTSVAGANFAQMGTSDGRPTGIVTKGSYAFVVTVRQSADKQLVLRAMEAQAARVS